VGAFSYERGTPVQVAALRAAGEPTVPTNIEQELATNPFLRHASPEIIKVPTPAERESSLLTTYWSESTTSS